MAIDLFEEYKSTVPRAERVDAKFIALEFWSQLRTSRGIWSRAQPRGGETTVQARERVVRETAEKNSKQKIATRKTAVGQALNYSLCAEYCYRNLIVGSKLRKMD
jgi:hypothetical protein